ncbi:hypothetical protein P3X46_023536 [Hevea brasiliensis]|uniref:Uncharacterized protein n=1 Tax=Hevea brasiliensis TaxID=3981 RepID=A0ABQ9LD44_HEVBR|nr:uncharacterized protein LOC131171959 [Hevea brasiliensis]KAJ9163914.1 hypothetical protein P3X46_023536 [Hevea brasiliensis]
MNHKEMKFKRKGNVYPFLSSPPSSSSYKDPDSVLKLLPVAILALALSLPNHDREVLAYLIARSLISTTTTHPYSCFNTNQHHSKNNCKTTNANGKKKCVQKVPLFECGCFDCYTSFWYRWDSSPNRELIHQVIEAFEDHLLQNESPSKHARRRKRGNKAIEASVESDISVNKPEAEAETSVGEDECEVVMMPENTEGGVVKENGVVCGEKMGKMTRNLKMGMVTGQALGANHKGLARKVLPDVMGLLKSRLWSLWGPGI